MAKSQRVVITLPHDMYAAIKKLAEYNRRSMAEEVRISIESRLDEIKRPKVAATIED